MKNLLILLLLCAIGYGAYYFLTQPLGSSPQTQDTEVETTSPIYKENNKAKTAKAPEKIAEPNAKATTTKGVDASTLSGKRLTHYYDYQTNSNLKLQAYDSRNLAQRMSKKQKKYQYRGTRPPKDWEVEFYNLFLNASEDEQVIADMATQFKRQAQQLDVTPVELAIAYVQDGIKYDDVKASYNEFLLQYPYETVYMQKGVCADKTILLSKLLTALDYKHVLMEFPKVSHMALGLKVPSKYGDFNTGYAFVETTSPIAIGEIPETYIQGFKIKEQPKLIFPRKNGKRTFIQMGDYKKKNERLSNQYGDAFKYGTTKQKQIAIEMKALEKKLEKMEAEHERRRCAEATVKTDEEFKICKKLTNDINKIVDEYNKLSRAFNKAARQ